MNATIKDIAKAAGISNNTVSRALNNKEDVKPETRERVLRIAKEMNYVPNQFAKSLRLKKSNLIGIVVTNIANPFYGQIIKKAAEIARANGYNIMLFNSDEDKAIESDILQTLKSAVVDGLIIAPVTADENTVARIKNLGIPFVLINRQPEIDEGINYVVNNDIKGAYLAARHLCERGVKTIHYLAGPEILYTAKQRIKGCKKVLNEFPGTKLIVHNIELTLDSSFEETQKILDRKENGKIGIFAYNDNLAIGSIRAITEKGLKMPSDIALIGYDDIFFASMLEVPLSTVRQSSTKIGRQGITLLLKNLDSKKKLPCEHIILEPELIIRSST